MISNLRSRYGGNKLFSLDTSFSSDRSILRADVLISDCSGIAFEYAFGTERPVVFVDVPIKIKNPRYIDLDIEPLELLLRPKMGVIVSPDKIDTIPGIVTSLQEQKERYREQLRHLRGKSVFSFGQSSSVGSKYILNALAD